MLTNDQIGKNLANKPANRAPDGANITIDGFVYASREQIESFDQFNGACTYCNPPGIRRKHEFSDDSGSPSRLRISLWKPLVERLSARDEDINRDGSSLMLDGTRRSVTAIFLASPGR